MFFREVMIAVFWKKKDNCILEKQELHYSGEIRIIVFRRNRIAVF
jgi:hypothetical protein